MILRFLRSRSAFSLVKTASTEAAPAAPRRQDWLVDVARGGIGQQSSVDEVLQTGGADAVLTDALPESCSIATCQEQSPWWTVDLGHMFPIQQIVIWNHRNPARQPAARHIRVAVSRDGQNWDLIHKGLAHFGAGDGPGKGGPPLRLWLGGRVVARHLRLSLDRPGQLHLSKVSVMAARMQARLHAILHEARLDTAGLYNIGDPLNFDVRHRLIGPAALEGAPVMLLDVSRWGRFANGLVQLTNALALARHMGVPQVRAQRITGFSPNGPIDADGVTLLPACHPIPQPGPAIVSDFFRLDAFDQTLAGATRRDRRVTVQRVLAPHLSLLRDLPQGDPRELVVHIRSGDIFGRNPHPYYVQPPLAFYRAIWSYARARDAVDRICIVAEDRANPCINAFEAWMTEQGVPVRVQSGTFKEDMRVLLTARHLVFGYGTFGVGMALLAGPLETVCVFAPKSMVQEYLACDNIFRLEHFEAGEDYIPAGGWRNTAEQRTLMLNYSEKALRRTVLRAP